MTPKEWCDSGGGMTSEQIQYAIKVMDSLANPGFYEIDAKDHQRLRELYERYRIQTSYSAAAVQAKAEWFQEYRTRLARGVDS
jgi:hypothetical protein